MENYQKQWINYLKNTSLINTNLLISEINDYYQHNGNFNLIQNFLIEKEPNNLIKGFRHLLLVNDRQFCDVAILARVARLSHFIEIFKNSSSAKQFVENCFYQLNFFHVNIYLEVVIFLSLFPDVIFNDKLLNNFFVEERLNSFLIKDDFTIKYYKDNL